MSDGQLAKAEPTAKQSVSNFLTQLPDRTEQIYWAAEEVLHDLAQDTSGSWDGAHLVKLNPNEEVILRLAGIMAGDELEASKCVHRHVARVRIELQQREIYRGDAALQSALTLARETAEREETESEKLRAEIRDAEQKLAALGDATVEAKANAEAIARAKARLEEVVPPYLQQQVEAARGLAMRSDAKKRLNEFEGRQHALDAQLQRISDWEEAEAYNQRNPKRQSLLPPKPSLTNEQLQDQSRLPEELAQAKRALKEQLKGVNQILDDFLEHGYRGPVAQ